MKNHLLPGLLIGVLSLLSAGCLHMEDRGKDDMTVENLPSGEARIRSVKLDRIPSGDTDLTVDFAGEGIPVGRELFGLVNYQYLYGNKKSPVASMIYRQLKPENTQARVEARFNLAEPENDNGDPGILDGGRFFSSEALPYSGDTAAFYSDLKDMNQEVLLLLDYNTQWNSTTGRFNGPPSSEEEWAEFALAIISDAVASGADVKYVEIWNEPNVENYWSGTLDEYYSLFNKTSEAIHKEFPGILVGGPVLSPDPSAGDFSRWISGFIENCGPYADFISFHSYSENPDSLIEKSKEILARFRAAAGGTGPGIIISEADYRELTPDDKFNYLLNRQIRLAEESGTFLGFHQFCLPRYSEGAYDFGLIDTDGSIIPHNYNPYFASRSLRGRTVPLTGSGLPVGVDAIASRDTGGEMESLILNNNLDRDISLDVRLDFPDDGKERTLSMFTIDSRTVRLTGTDSIISGSAAYRITIPPSGAVSLEIASGRQEDFIFGTFEVDDDSLIVGDSTTGLLTVTNRGSVPVSGKVTLVGQNQDWDVEYLDSRSFEDMNNGDSLSCRVRITAKSATPKEGAAVLAYIQARRSGERSLSFAGIPLKLRVLAPVDFDIVPRINYAAPGEDSSILVKARNSFTEDIRGRLSADFPGGWSHSPGQDYMVKEGKRAEYLLSFTLPEGTEPGEYPVKVSFEYMGTDFSREGIVFVRDYPRRRSLPVDISAYFDSDLFTGEDAFDDVDNFGGPFSYPARFYPSGETAGQYGWTFAFPPTETGMLNALRLDKGPYRISLPEYNCSGLAVLVSATNGNKEIEFALEYTEGNRETVTKKITDWCVDAKYDEVEVMKAPYRHLTTGILQDAEPRITLINIETDSGRKLKSLSVPQESDFWLIALTLDKAEEN
ncbi:MAG: hypothetical protein JXR86_17965 [Spirochaetales bacterium]|nr:hypothetical protein [Spirochaetales bacterium]